MTPSPLRRNREFVALWVGQAVSFLGITISSFAYPVLVLEETGSAVKAGLVGSILAGTAFFLRLPAGVLVDRWNRRTILIACDAGRALNAATFATALALGHFWYEQVLLVAFFEAALGVLFGPAETAAVRRVVPHEQLRDAIAQNQSRTAVPGLVGPPLAGALLTASRALPFVADAITYVVSLACIVSVRTPLGGGVRTSDRRPLASVFDGIRWIWSRPFLRAFLLWFVGIGTVFSSFGLVVLVRARDLGATPGELGVMFAISSVGGVAGALVAPAVLRHFSRRTVIVVFGWIAVAAAFLLLAAPTPYVLGVLGAISFFLAPSVNSIGLTAIAEEADDEMQGRATSAAIQISALGAPVGPLLAGLLIAAVGTEATIVVYGCVLALHAAVSSTVRAFQSADRIGSSSARS